jgi:hypothetical protein
LNEFSAAASDQSVEQIAGIFIYINDYEKRNVVFGCRGRIGRGGMRRSATRICHAAARVGVSDAADGSAARAWRAACGDDG